MPRPFQLRTYNLPDVGDYLIHFTGRTGRHYDVPADIAALDPPSRLAQILNDGRIRAVPTFGTGNRPVVAFTESVQASVLQLIQDGRYTPWGIGFSKQFVFEQGGGPVLYVRGDEWPAAEQFPDPLRSRIVRFWPGAEWEQGDPVFLGTPFIPDHLAKPSEWLHEREWRVPHDVRFGWGDVRFLIVPSRDWPAGMAHQYGVAYGAEYEQHFQNIPVVAIHPSGRLLFDGSGIWQQGAAAP